MVEENNLQKQEDSITANLRKEEQETPYLGVTSEPKKNKEE